MKKRWVRQRVDVAARYETRDEPASTQSGR
jgi:hypothetical protein